VGLGNSTSEHSAHDEPPGNFTSGLEHGFLRPSSAATAHGDIPSASGPHNIFGNDSRAADAQVDPSTLITPTDFVFGQSGLHAEAAREAAALQTAKKLQVKMIDVHGEFHERREWAEAFLKRYYAEFVESFPDTKERPTIDTLREHILDPDMDFRVFAFEINGEVVGGQHLRILKTDRDTFGVIEHLWVSRDQRKAGLGAVVIQMSEQVLEKQGAAFCLAEFNDPALMTSQEVAEDVRSGITPEGRLRFWSRQGYSVIDAPYIQPALQPGEDAVEYLMLGIKPLLVMTDIGPAIESGRLLRALHAYFASFAPLYLEDERIVRVLSGIGGQENVAVANLELPRTFRQTRPLLEQ
jgi:GNAT superfamily N-acetyltransferase